MVRDASADREGREDDDVAFTMEKATFQRRDDEIGTRLDVAVSPRTTSRCAGSW